MGGKLTKIFKGWFGSKEMRVLMLGLDSAGTVDVKIMMYMYRYVQCYSYWYCN